MILRLIACSSLALLIYAQDTPAPDAAKTAQDTAKTQDTTAPAQGQETTKTRRTTSSSSNSSEQPSHRWFHIGGVVDYFPLGLMQGGTSNSTVNGNNATLTSKAVKTNLGGGAILDFQLSSRLTLDLQYLYRHAGYDTSDALGDTAGTILSERTRFTYWDVPMVVRYQAHRYRLLHQPLFYEAGGAWRRVTTIRTSDMTLTSSYAICCSEIPATPAHNNVVGIVIGTGFQFRDEMGVRVTPGIRYTRWLEHTFDAGPTQSRPDQIEVTLGVTF